MSAAEAGRLDAVDQAALSKPVMLADAELQCPRCRARMRRFQDPLLPTDSHIARCTNCEGMWFNRGELRHFKGRSNVPAAGDLTHGQIDHLTNSIVKDAKSWPIVHNFDSLFEPQDEPADPSLRREMMTAAVWLVARTALRLLLHI